MSFGLTNAPTILIVFIYSNFMKYFDLFIIVFIDYSFIYSWSEDKYVKNLELCFEFSIIEIDILSSENVSFA